MGGGGVEHIPKFTSCPIEGQRDIPILYERMVFTMTDAAKEARRAYMRQWRKNNRAAIREYQRNWRDANPDKVRGHSESFWERKAQQTMPEGGAT